MRLSEQHRQVIKRLVAELVGADAQVLLFGSRVDDEARGGDVDVLVIDPATALQPVHHAAQATGVVL